MKEKLKRYLPFVFLFLLSFWAVLPFFTKGLPNTHDGLTHIMRLASFHQALLDGQFPPRWASNLAYGYGSPVLSFGFQLPYFLGDFFHLLGFSFIEAIKIVFILGYVLSGVFMYLFLKKLTLPSAALVGASLYLLAPYRFLDLYVRGDVGESLVFVFPPLILWLLWEKKIFLVKMALAIFATGLMFLSHQIMAAVFSVIIFILLVFQGKVLSAFTAIIGGMILAAYNLLPLIFERGFTNLGFLVQTNYQNQFPKISSIFYSKWNWGPALPDNPALSMPFQLGMAQWLSLAILTSVLIWQFWQGKFKEEVFLLRFPLLILGLFGFLLFLITSYSKFLWDSLFFLQAVLYPWRLLGAEVFLTALIGALVIQLIKLPWLKVFLVLVLLTLAFYGNRNHNQVAGRTIHDDQFYLSFPGTSDMWGEFLPQGASLPKEAPNQKIDILDGQVTINNLQAKSNQIVFSVGNAGNSLLRVNNFYYPGWEVLIDDQKVSLEKSQTLDFMAPRGSHLIKVQFTETPVRTIADWLSLISLISIFTLFMFKFLKR